MASLTQDFLASRRRASRNKKLLLPAVIIFLAVAGTAAAGFYFYQKHNQAIAAKAPVVAGATTLNVQHLPKAWLEKYFHTDNENDPKVGGVYGDPDHDGLPNILEYYYGSDPTNPDTNGDGITDGISVALNLDPAGSGELKLSAPVQQNIDQYISSNPDLQTFAKDQLVKKLSAELQTDRPVILDSPQTTELKIIEDNSVPAMEKYYNDTLGILAADSNDQDTSDTLLAMSPEQLNQKINKANTVIDLMKKTPVPSQLLPVHLLRIADLNASRKILELIRDRYNNGTPDNQFWPDLYYQGIVGQTAENMEVAVWQQVGKALQDKGGL